MEILNEYDGMQFAQELFALRGVQDEIEKNKCKTSKTILQDFSTIIYLKHKGECSQIQRKNIDDQNNFRERNVIYIQEKTA